MALWKATNPGKNGKSYGKIEARTMNEALAYARDIWRGEIMEVITARLGMFCHKRNNKFDSFKFNAAVKRVPE